MSLIRAGTFQMGSPANEVGREPYEGPRHAVTVPRFELGQIEVTVAEFRAFVTATGYQTSAEQSGGCVLLNADTGKKEKDANRNWRSPGFVQQDTHPVTCVSFSDAQAYAE